MTDLAAIAAQLDRIERKVDALLDGHGEAPEAETRAAIIEAELVERAGELGVTIRPGGLVGEYDAARLIGKGATTLRNWRHERCPLPYSKLGGRITYSLRDLAECLAERE